MDERERAKAKATAAYTAAYTAAADYFDLPVRGGDLFLSRRRKSKR